MDPKGPRGYLAEYMQQGWIADVVPSGNPSPPYAGGKAGAATTLEYSWDDYAMALYAKKLGKTDDYTMFLTRAHNYQNVFDPSVGFMRGRTEDGQWTSPFDPGEPYYNFMTKEASGWSTLWLAAHDVAGLETLLGGLPRHGRPGLDVIVLRDERDGLLPRRPIQPRLHFGQSHLRRGQPSHGQLARLKIIAKNNTDRNAYIQSATLNGKVWNKTYFSHADIVDGGVLVLTMVHSQSEMGNCSGFRPAIDVRPALKSNDLRVCTTMSLMEKR